MFHPYAKVRGEIDANIDRQGNTGGYYEAMSWWISGIATRPA